MIDFFINKLFGNIDIEELKKDHIMYSIFLTDLISRVEGFCETYNKDKTEIYQIVGNILYK